MCMCAELCPENTIIQAEITDQHNAYRRAVQPTASNMLKMVSPVTNHTINVSKINFSNNSQLLWEENKVGEVFCTHNLNCCVLDIRKDLWRCKVNPQIKKK